MKAIRVHAPGGPEALRYEDVAQPGPGAGQVLVKVDAAGVNYIDVYQRTGMYPEATPVALGRDRSAAAYVARACQLLQGSRVMQESTSVVLPDRVLIID